MGAQTNRSNLQTYEEGNAFCVDYSVKINEVRKFLENFDCRCDNGNNGIEGVQQKLNGVPNRFTYRTVLYSM